MHKHGVMHRDVKPENVLLCNRGRGGEGHAAKLADFGASRIVDAERFHLDLADEFEGTDSTSTRTIRTTRWIDAWTRRARRRS